MKTINKKTAFASHRLTGKNQNQVNWNNLFLLML